MNEMSTSLSSLHTTLAQDAYRLYYGVIDYVSKNLKNDLKNDGKTSNEADIIIKKLTQKWKDNLKKSKCIDGGGLLGVNDHTPNIPRINIDNPFQSINDNNNNNDSFNSDLPPAIPDAPSNNGDTIYTPPPYSELMFSNNNSNNDNNNNGYSGVHAQGPARKRQRLNNTSFLPQIVPQNYPNSNPHVQGMGVPSMEQIPNPFINPGPQVSQHDGPLPMMSTENTNSNVVGFSDDDDDIKTVNHNNNNSLKQESTDEKTNSANNDKSEDNNNDNNNVNASITNNNDNNNNNNDDNKNVMDNNGHDNSTFTEPLIINGRDLNGPLNSDDDDNDDEINLNPDDKIYCQFIKVNRRKSEWSVELKHGIMHVNGKDYAFINAKNGKFIWD